MAPIEGFISSPTFQKEIIAGNSKDKHLRIYDINLDLTGELNGGIASIKRDSKKNSTELHLKQGEIQEKSYTVVAKGGVLEEIKMRFIGK